MVLNNVTKKSYLFFPIENLFPEKQFAESLRAKRSEDLDVGTVLKPAFFDLRKTLSQK